MIEVKAKWTGPSRARYIVLLTWGILVSLLVWNTILKHNIWLKLRNLENQSICCIVFSVVALSTCGYIYSKSLVLCFAYSFCLHGFLSWLSISIVRYKECGNLIQPWCLQVGPQWGGDEDLIKSLGGEANDWINLRDLQKEGNIKKTHIQHVCSHLLPCEAL
jgi:hypothetical protein